MMTTRGEFATTAGLGTVDYLRQRLHPSPADPLYLHLSDLKLALETAATAPGARVLDYGCGGSPYRALFQTGHYHRADIQSTPDVDFVFGEDSRVAAADAGYDCVLSTQVLEHVKHVDVYLGECRRVLRRSGQLILTTHGTFNDHGCPYDFWRWTAEGLQVELERAGFKLLDLRKLTTGPRALLFLNQQFHSTLLPTERSFAAGLIRISRLVYSRFERRRLNAFADREYAHCRVVPSGASGHDLYIALQAVAARTD